MNIAGSLFFLICAAGAVTSLVLFRQDLNRTLQRLGESPIASVTYRYKAVQRRFADRVLWDRLRQESPVYSLDIIRTAALSEATVRFSKTPHVIDIHENTLIQIREDEIEVQSGGISVDLQSGSSSLRISSGDSAVELYAEESPTGTANGSASVFVIDGNLDVRVRTGRAELRDVTQQGGRTITAGMSSTAGIVVANPRPQAKFLNTEQGPLPVVFSWDAKETLTLDIALDRRFTRLVHNETGLSGRTITLENGVYYWRLYSANRAGVSAPGISGRLQILYAPAPVLIRPSADERFSFRTERPGIRFQWSTQTSAAAYLVEVFFPSVTR